MLTITPLTVGELSSNCYLVTENDQCLIIDPGDEADFISQTILENKLTPLAILLTHGHFDHVLGCLELKLNFSIPLYLHRKDLFLYQKANDSSSHWTKKASLSVPPVDHFYKNEDEIKIGSEKLIVIETPGHTPGSVCFYDGKNILFSGDTLFKDAVGRTNLSYSSPLQLNKSLGKIFKLPDHTVVYPGHGESTFLNIEKTNYFKGR